jgi:hypothetical protein
VPATRHREIKELIEMHAFTASTKPSRSSLRTRARRLGARRPHRRPLGARLLAPAALALSCLLGGPLATPALATRQVSVNDTVRTGLANSSLADRRRTTVLDERGAASGSIGCSVTMQVDITYTTAVMSFACSSRSGTLSGLARTSFVVSGAIANFNGTLSLSSGTGSYAHVAGSVLRMKGVVQRHTDSLVASIVGSMKL